MPDDRTPAPEPSEAALETAKETIGSWVLMERARCLSHLRRREREIVDWQIVIAAIEDAP